MSETKPQIDRLLQTPDIERRRYAGQQFSDWLGKNGYKTLFVYFLTKEKIKMSEYKGHWPEFEQQIFSIPPVELANTFVSKIKSFVSEMVVLEKENVKLKESRDQLLAKLI